MRAALCYGDRDSPQKDPRCLQQSDWMKGPSSPCEEHWEHGNHRVIVLKQIFNRTYTTYLISIIFSSPNTKLSTNNKSLAISFCQTHMLYFPWFSPDFLYCLLAVATEQVPSAL